MNPRGFPSCHPLGRRVLLAVRRRGSAQHVGTRRPLSGGRSVAAAGMGPGYDPSPHQNPNPALWGEVIPWYSRRRKTALRSPDRKRVRLYWASCRWVALLPSILRSICLMRAPVPACVRPMVLPVSLPACAGDSPAAPDPSGGSVEGRQRTSAVPADTSYQPSTEAQIQILAQAEARLPPGERLINAALTAVYTSRSVDAIKGLRRQTSDAGLNIADLANVEVDDCNTQDAFTKDAYEVLLSIGLDDAGLASNRVESPVSMYDLRALYEFFGGKIRPGRRRGGKSGPWGLGVLELSRVSAESQVKSFARLQRLGSPIVDAVLDGALGGFRRGLEEKMGVPMGIVESTSLDKAPRSARKSHLEEVKKNTPIKPFSLLRMIQLGIRGSGRMQYS
ncbi:hypothetical protein HPB49_010379 [Dermacentor silvarum]|uniref:Uncharacterized protein n=1 Tax=Dermacentor silvarum TaxID=543639 RepID=A0ACB8DP79_DERSI|nr:hypothetical protein HPB49_010379 [Dermacentor silvarum]